MSVTIQETTGITIDVVRSEGIATRRYREADRYNMIGVLYVSHKTLHNLGEMITSLPLPVNVHAFLLITGAAP